MPLFMGTRCGVKFKRTGFSCRIAQLFLDLRRVTVAGHAVGLDVLIDLAVEVVHLGSPSGSGGTGFGVDDDGVRIDESLF